jgi:hypothetical protein
MVISSKRVGVSNVKPQSCIETLSTSHSVTGDASQKNRDLKYVRNLCVSILQSSELWNSVVWYVGAVFRSNTLPSSSAQEIGVICFSKIIVLIFPDYMML